MKKFFSGFERATKIKTFDKLRIDIYRENLRWKA